MSINSQLSLTPPPKYSQLSQLEYQHQPKESASPLTLRGTNITEENK